MRLRRATRHEEAVRNTLRISGVRGIRGVDVSFSIALKVANFEIFDLCTQLARFYAEFFKQLS